MITKRMIDEDINKIREILREHDFVIPGMWQIISPVLCFLVVPPVLQVLFSIEVSTDSGQVGISDFFSIYFTAFITLLVSLASLNFRSRYLSFPKAIRNQSVIIKLVVFKVRVYAALWMCGYICIGLYVLMTPEIRPYVSAMGLLGTLFLAVTMFNIDMARFELSALNKLYDLWKENKL